MIKEFNPDFVVLDFDHGEYRPVSMCWQRFAENEATNHLPVIKSHVKIT